MTARFAPLVLACTALALAPLAPPARAAVVNMPPVTITNLTHQFFGTAARDVIFIPGTGYSGPGGTLTFGTGDIVRVRVEPPPGKKFLVRSRAAIPPAPGSSGNFSVNLHWAGAGGGLSQQNPWSVTFENFRGIPPVATYTLAFGSDVVVETWFDYDTFGDFEFTAFQVDITIDQPLARVPRVFGEVSSYASPSLGAATYTKDPTFKAMEIVVDGVVPSLPSSWGRIKSLIR
jgi:hypothetical protein